MMPVQLLISIVYCVLSKNKKELLIYNAFLLLFAEIGILLNAVLYFTFICYDSEGVLVVLFEIRIAAIYIGTITGIELLIKYIVDKFRIKK